MEPKTWIQDAADPSSLKRFLPVASAIGALLPNHPDLSGYLALGYAALSVLNEMMQNWSKVRLAEINAKAAVAAAVPRTPEADAAILTGAK